MKHYPASLSAERLSDQGYILKVTVHSIDRKRATGKKKSMTGYVVHLMVDKLKRISRKEAVIERDN